MTATLSTSTTPDTVATVVPPAGAKAGRREGERRRDVALSMLAARRAGTVTRARRALLSRLLAAGAATADDVRDALGDLPHDIGPRCLGAVPTDLARAGIISADGYTRTARPTAHARPVTVWRLVDAAAARRWLDDHPEPTDDCDDLPLWHAAHK